MADWQIALIAAGAALLGTLLAAGAALWGVHLQTKHERELEDIRRIREVREKRIDKVEEYMKISLKNSMTLLEIRSEESKKIVNQDNIENFTKEIKSELQKMNLLDQYLLIACIYSLHDDVLNNFVVGLNAIRSDIRRIIDSEIPKDEMLRKEYIEKLDTFSTNSVNLLSAIFRHLDDLRTK